MQKATKASRSLPSSVLRESFKKALEILEDSPTDSLFESMRVISYLEWQLKKNYFPIINYFKVHCVNYLVTKPLIQF